MRSRTVLYAAGALTLSACTEPALDDHEQPLDRGGGGGYYGGWDYNNNRFNSALEGLTLGPTAPYGDAGPNTIDAYRNVVFHLQPTSPVACVTRDSTITAVRVVGSSGDGAGNVWGPRVMVQRATGTTPLAIGQRTAVAALVRTQVTPLAEAEPVTLVVERVRDFVRPGGWVRWPHYAVTMYDAACTPTWLTVAIFGPALELPTSAAAPVSLATIAGAVVPYAGFYDEIDPSLMAKAAINLDAPLTFTGESGGSGVSCVAGTQLPANHLAFLGALATGAAVVTHHPSDEQRRPVIVFRTRKGQPFRAIASAMVGGVAQGVCHRDDLRPPGTLVRAANAKVAWPVGLVSTMDVVHGTGLLTVAGEVAASTFTWLVSGTSDARKQAFLQSSENPHRHAYSQQADGAIANVSIKTLDGAATGWSALNGLFADRASLVVAAETLPPWRAGEGAEHATDHRMLNPVLGDGICSVGEVLLGGGDCPVNPPPPPPPPSDGGMPDAAWYAPDAGSYTPDAGSYTPDAGSGSPDAGSYYAPDAGSSYTPDAGSSYTPDAGSSYTPDAGSSYTPDAATYSYSDGGGPG